MNGPADLRREMRPDRHSESGVVAVVVALSMTAVMIAAAMVLDFGLVRMDRQVNKSSADSASIAGMQSAGGGEYEKMFPFRGACGALRFIKANHPSMATLSGTWKRGDGSSVTGDPCDPSSSWYSAECTAGSPPTWAWFHGTAAGLAVDIKSGYKVSDGGFAEEAHMGTDPGAGYKGGCDQLAVIIEQTRSPGVGSLATSSDMKTTVRSVARMTPPGPPKEPFALLLLERENCNALDVNGTGPRVFVEAKGNAPGRIHSDALGFGADCSTGQQVMNGNSFNGIVAQKSPTKPGAITVRALNGDPLAQPGKAFDAPPMVVSEGQPGDQPIAGKLMTRVVVDKPYRVGVKNAINVAKAAWASVPQPGDKIITHCRKGDDPTVLDALNHPGTVYFNCPTNGNGAFPVNYDMAREFRASRVIVNGEIKTSMNLSFPNLEEMYVKGYTSSGTATGIDIGSNQLRVNQGVAGPTTCPGGNRSLAARIVIGWGGITATNNSLLQLCNTSVILMGDGPSGTGCVPSVDGLPPVLVTPCDGAVLSVKGGVIEWTAPNKVAATVTPADQANLEDLALWTESAGPLHGVGGGGSTHVAGLFMLANANHFALAGSPVQNMENSQYVVRRLRVAGNATITLSPNPDDSVKVPEPTQYSLVR